MTSCGKHIRFGSLVTRCARDAGHSGRCLPTRAQAIAELEHLDRAADELADLVMQIDLQRDSEWPPHERLFPLVEAFESEWARRRGIRSSER